MNSSNSSALLEAVDPIHMGEILVLSTVFILVGLVGLMGNILVIVAVITDKKMRDSATNLLIINLCVADLFLMSLTIPEIVMFMLNHGWLMGHLMCRVERFILVFAVYNSVMTLVALCVERYIAIVHPVRARIFCSKKRIRLVIACIWLWSLLCGLPVLLFNQVAKLNPSLPPFCIIRFPDGHLRYFIPWKYTESVVFYFVPMIVQIVLYTIICRRLFASTLMLYNKQTNASADGRSKKRERSPDAVRSRKSVVKMLIASVVIYFISYSPHQVMLIYNTVSPRPFNQTWLIHVFVTMMTFLNSAASPILYCIFSQNFRYKFKSLLQCRKPSQAPVLHSTTQSYSYNCRTQAVNTRVVYSQYVNVQESL